MPSVYPLCGSPVKAADDDSALSPEDHWIVEQRRRLNHPAAQDAGVQFPVQVLIAELHYQKPFLAVAALAAVYEYRSRSQWIEFTVIMKLDVLWQADGLLQRRPKHNPQFMGNAILVFSGHGLGADQSKASTS